VSSLPCVDEAGISDGRPNQTTPYLACLLDHARLRVLIGGIGRDKHLDRPGFDGNDADRDATQARTPSNNRVGPSRLGEGASNAERDNVALSRDAEHQGYHRRLPGSLQAASLQ
jgi:hypothetical protein